MRILFLAYEAIAGSGPCHDHPSDFCRSAFVDRLAGELVAVELEAPEVLGEPYPKAEDFQLQIGGLQQRLSDTLGLGLDQGIQQLVKVAFDPLAQDKAMMTGKPARVVARPENQVVGLAISTNSRSRLNADL